MLVAIKLGSILVFILFLVFCILVFLFYHLCHEDVGKIFFVYMLRQLCRHKHPHTLSHEHTYRQKGAHSYLSLSLSLYICISLCV